MGQTVKQCLGCSTDMEAWISYIVLDVIHEDQCAETGSMTPDAHHAFKHHPLSASAAQGNICKTAMPRLGFVVASCLPTVSFHLISPGLQNLVVRSNSQRLGTLCHETWGPVRRKLLNSLFKWKALCSQNFHIKLTYVCWGILQCALYSDNLCCNKLTISKKRKRKRTHRWHPRSC